MTYEDNNWSWHYISALLGFGVTPFPSTSAARPPLPPSTPCGGGRAPDCPTKSVSPETALRLLADCPSLAGSRPTPRFRLFPSAAAPTPRSEEHTSELQSRQYLVCR